MSNGELTELRRGQIDLARDAMKVAILINGAAGIAMLTFLGNLDRKGITLDSARDLAYPLFLFGSGVLSGTLSIAFSYFSQTCFLEILDVEKANKFGNYFRFFATLTTLFSLGLFFAGIWLFRPAITHYLSGG